MTFTCLKDCSECCGFMTFKKEFVELHISKLTEAILNIKKIGNEYFFETKDLKCIFLNRTTNKCNIYDFRPEICKRYGSSGDPLLLCPYLKPSGNLRSENSTKQVLRGIKNRLETTMSNIKKRKL